MACALKRDPTFAAEDVGILRTRASEEAMSAEHPVATLPFPVLQVPLKRSMGLRASVFRSEVRRGFTVRGRAGEYGRRRAPGCRGRPGSMWRNR